MRGGVKRFYGSVGGGMEGCCVKICWVCFIGFERGKSFV